MMRRGDAMRKKRTRPAVAAACLIFALSSCSGHFYVPVEVKPKSQYERSFLASADWFGDNGSRLTFSADGSAVLNGRLFSWTESDGCVECIFAPDTCVGKTLKFYEKFDYGLPTLSGEDAAYSIAKPHFDDEASDNEELAADLTAEELAASEGQQAANMCFGFIGWNYKYGGKSPETGFDCSGLVYYVYEQLGYRIERVANDQAKQGILIEKEDIQPGDVLCFGAPGYCSHVGIYVGQGYYIHAMGSAYGVVASSLNDPYLKRPQYEIRRFVGCDWLKAEVIDAALASGQPAPTPPPT